MECGLTWHSHGLRPVFPSPQPLLDEQATGPSHFITCKTAPRPILTQPWWWGGRRGSKEGTRGLKASSSKGTQNWHLQSEAGVLTWDTSRYKQSGMPTMDSSAPRTKWRRHPGTIHSFIPHVFIECPLGVKSYWLEVLSDSSSKA